jgi:3-oxoisoapionate decarboxylase
VTRRHMLRLTTAGMAAAATSASLTGQGQTPPPSPSLRHLGATPAGFAVRNKLPGWDILDYTHSLGLGAVEMRPPAPTPDAAAALRKRLDAYNMRVVFDIRLPKTAADVSDFEKIISLAKDVNAVCVHAAMTGRRYEDFDTLAAFQASFAQNKQAVTLAEPVLRKHRVKLAIENHKGWRAAEQADWLKSVGSEYVGVCFDFGNNISLCEDPAETLRILAPYTCYGHLKDMAVAPYDDGFLLSEVPLGEGLLDIPTMVAQLQAKDPNIVIGLEMIARDPLKIPVFTDKYWVSFADASSPLPGRDLAHTLMMVKAHPPQRPLPRLTGLTPEAQLTLETECIARSIEFARNHLSL